MHLNIKQLCNLKFNNQITTLDNHQLVTQLININDAVILARNKGDIALKKPNISLWPFKQQA